MITSVAIHLLLSIGGLFVNGNVILLRVHNLVFCQFCIGKKFLLSSLLYCLHVLAETLPLVPGPLQVFPTVVLNTFGPFEALGLYLL